jgi:hypothetical protein
MLKICFAVLMIIIGSIYAFYSNKENSEKYKEISLYKISFT